MGGVRPNLWDIKHEERKGLDVVKADWFACNYKPNKRHLLGRRLSDRTLSKLLKPVSTPSLGQLLQ